MNRRQKKKAYKKKYGHNPPKTEIKYHAGYWAKTISKTMEAVAYTIRAMVPAIQEAFENAATALQEAIERIKTMPEEEFNRWLESTDMEEGVKTLAKQIRRNGQNGTFKNSKLVPGANSEGTNAEGRTTDN